MRVGPTPSQTVGPFFRLGLAWLGPSRHLVEPGSDRAIALSGRVVDGDGAAVPDAVVEIWQADDEGGFPPDCWPGWRGFGRAVTDRDGGFGFTTVIPGAVDAEQAPHIDVSVFSRGLLQRVVTRVYFPDHPANAGDPVLRSVPADRRPTLIAQSAGEGALRFDVRLQGADETVFFAW